MHEKISICELINECKDDECLDIIQAIAETAGWDAVKQMIRQYTITTSIFTYEYLKIIAKSTNVKKALTTGNAHDISRSATESTTTSLDNVVININDVDDGEEEVIFPLLRLPIDLIGNVSFFLNDKNILQFEQCCR